MIQRKQTLWLLLATAAAIFTFMFPFATGEQLDEKTAMKSTEEITAGSHFLILILTIATIGISAITIFMFKDRKLQLKLCILGFLISIGIIILFVLEMNKLHSAKPYLYALLPLLVPVFYFLAIKGIRNDEKLVKSTDKLR